MKAREVSVILATGGMGLVRAAYSAGKPAYGVGPGNAPCYIESSADIRKAANDILTGKSFDNGVLCSSPNSVVVDQAVEAEARRQFLDQGGYFLSPAEADALAKQLVTPQRLPNPALVGKSATFIAEKLGITVPAGTRALIAELKGVGPRLPAVDREAVPGAVLLRRQGLARRLRALQGDPALRRHGPHHVDPLAERRGDPRVRPAQAGLPHLREHPDHARIDRPDDRPRSGDDARAAAASAATSPRTTSRRGTCSTSSGWPTSCGPRQCQGARCQRCQGVGARCQRARSRPRCPKAPAKPQPDSISTRRTDDADRQVPGDSRAGTRHRAPGTLGTAAHPWHPWPRRGRRQPRNSSARKTFVWRSGGAKAR